MRVERIGNATLYLGDCLEILPSLQKADTVLTDPPYGVNVATWDKEINAVWVSLLNSADDCNAFVFWSVSRILDFVPLPGFAYERVLVWHKPMTFSNQRGGATWHWEPIFWYRKGKARLSESVSDVITVNPPLTRLHQENEAHPTQKPLGIIEPLVGLSSGLILDPFMGSGTTGVACSRMGREFIGVEQEPKYFDIACRRIEDSQRQERLFA